MFLCNPIVGPAESLLDAAVDRAQRAAVLPSKMSLCRLCISLGSKVCSQRGLRHGRFEATLRSGFSALWEEARWDCFMRGQF